MSTFVNKYLELLNNPNLKPQIGNQVYDLGMAFYKTKTDLYEREDILLKLLFLFAERSDLYFYMAELLKSINIPRALTWHKICHQLDPRNKENIIAMIKSMFESGLACSVLEMVQIENNKHNIYYQLMDDPRFLSIYARCNFQQLRYQNGVPFLLKLIKQYSTQSCNTKEEKKEKWSNYHDLGYVYSAMGEIEKSLQYTKKASELAVKFDLDMNDKLLSFSNVLCYSEFLYADQGELYKEYLKINNYLPDKPMFKFSARQKNAKIKIAKALR